MADNTILNTGTGGDTIATDELMFLNGGIVVGIKVQRIKLGFGADASLRDVDSANPLPVFISDGTTQLKIKAASTGAPVAADPSLVVSLRDSLPAGTAFIGRVRQTDGTNDATIKAASVVPVAADTAVVVTQRDPLPAGSNNLGTIGLNIGANFVGKFHISDSTNDVTIRAASSAPVATDIALVVTQRDPLPAGAASIGTVGLNAGTAAIGTVAITTGAASIGTVGLNAGTASIGTVGLNAGTAAIGTVALTTGAASIGTVGLNSGTNSIGTVGINAGAAVDIKLGPGPLTGTGSLTLAGQAITLATGGRYANTVFQVSGTWVGTLTFEASNDGFANSTTINAFRSGESTISQSITDSASNDLYRCTTAGFNAVRIRASAFTAGSAAITAVASEQTSGVFLNFPLPAGTNSIGTVVLATGTASIGTVGLNAGTAAIGTVAITAGTTSIGTVGLNAGTAAIGTVAMAALTKATQGTTGVTTQDLKDSGRTRVSIVFQGVAPATGDTLLSLVKISNGVAAAAATSNGVAAGKILRIISVSFSIKSGAAAAAFATLTFRQNPGGATVIGSVSEFRIDVGNTAATIGASDKVEMIFPDGLEFTGTQTLGASLAAQAISNVISISLNGFEY